MRDHVTSFHSHSQLPYNSWTLFSAGAALVTRDSSLSIPNSEIPNVLNDANDACVGQIVLYDEQQIHLSVKDPL